jgi:hypothetical protein
MPLGTPVVEAGDACCVVADCSRAPCQAASRYHRSVPPPKRPKRSLKLAIASLVVTLLILALQLIPYAQRW